MFAGNLNQFDWSRDRLVAICVFSEEENWPVDGRIGAMRQGNWSPSSAGRPCRLVRSAGVLRFRSSANIKTTPHSMAAACLWLWYDVCMCAYEFKRVCV